MTLQEDELVASSAPSSVLQIPFTSGRIPNKNSLLGVALSSLTLTTSPAQSIMGGSGCTPMSTPFQARSDLTIIHFKIEEP